MGKFQCAPPFGLPCAPMQPASKPLRPAAKPSTAPNRFVQNPRPMGTAPASQPRPAPGTQPRPGLPRPTQPAPITPQVRAAVHMAGRAMGLGGSSLALGAVQVILAVTRSGFFLLGIGSVF